MVKATVRRWWDGYIVVVTGKDEYGALYLTKAYKGNYAYMRDYAYAKTYRDKRTAVKHAKRIEMEG